MAHFENQGVFFRGLDRIFYRNNAFFLRRIAEKNYTIFQYKIFIFFFFYKDEKKAASQFWEAKPAST